MSIHSLAKELGVSEYALITYARKNKVPRKDKNRGSGYEFTQEDLNRIKLNYNSKPEPVELLLMYRIYDSNRRNHIYLPAGILPKQDEALLKEFLEIQCSTANVFHLKCHNFFICTPRQYKSRLKKLSIEMGQNFAKLTIQEMVPKFITHENLPEYVENRTVIEYEDFVPEIARNYFAKKYFINNSMSLDEISEDEERLLTYDDLDSIFDDQ